MGYSNEGNEGIIQMKVTNLSSISNWWAAVCGLNRQLLNNFLAQNSCDHKQLEAEVKNGVAYKKKCIAQKRSVGLWKFSIESIVKIKSVTKSNKILKRYNKS